MRYELRVDEDFGGDTLWFGNRRPTPHQIDDAAEQAMSRGWNGVLLDLYRDDRFVETVKPSEDVLS